MTGQDKDKERAGRRRRVGRGGRGGEIVEGGAGYDDGALALDDRPFQTRRRCRCSRVLARSRTDVSFPGATAERKAGRRRRVGRGGWE